jgi:hypothetical protein
MRSNKKSGQVEGTEQLSTLQHLLERNRFGDLSEGFILDAISEKAYVKTDNQYQ